MNMMIPGTESSVLSQFSAGGGNTRSMEFNSCDAAAMAPADVKECPGSFEYLIDMPGIKSGDIKVQVGDGNMLTISGVRKRPEVKTDEKYVRRDRKCGTLMQEFVLPVNSNTDEIKAVCKDGVLTVTVEKSLPKKPRIIEVQGS